jgi:hypothetical protein
MVNLKRLRQSIQNRYIYLVVGLLVITMLMFLVLPEVWMFQGYTTLFFPLVRRLFDGLSYFIKVPFLYLLILVCLFRIAFSFWRVLNFSQGKNLLSKLYLLVGRFLKSIGVIIILFYWLWGFNYASLSFLDYNDIDPQPVEFEWVESEYFRVLDTLNILSADNTSLRWANFDQYTLDNSLGVFFSQHYVNADLDPVVSEIFPKGFLLRLGAQGIYLPWTGQGQIDAGLHDLQKPFTYLHEMSHGYGITNEGECNLIAFLVGKDSESNYVRYSAYLSYWRYLARQMLNVGCHDTDLLSEDLKIDLQAIFEIYDKYPDFFPRFRVTSYDLYLKVQGVEEGMKSYSEIIMMNHAWSNSSNL